MIVIVALTLTLLGSSVSACKKGTDSVDFYKCISCDQNKIDKYMNCSLSEPEPWVHTFMQCQLDITSKTREIQEMWSEFCKNHDELLDKMHSCWLEKRPPMNELNDEEIEGAKNYMDCAVEVDDKHCPVRSK